MGPNNCFNKMQGNKLCGVISNSALIFYCAVRLDTKLTAEGGSNKPRNCSASHMFVSRGLPTCQMLIRKSVYDFMIYLQRGHE